MNLTSVGGRFEPAHAVPVRARAKILGIERKTLYRKLERIGL